MNTQSRRNPGLFNSRRFSRHDKDIDKNQYRNKFMETRHSIDGANDARVRGKRQGQKRACTEPIELMAENGDGSTEHLPKIATSRPHFPKPYLENTKFVDLLVKNKRLLRRGLFDLPLEKLEVVVPQIPKLQKSRPNQKNSETIAQLKPTKIKSTAFSINPQSMTPQTKIKSCNLLRKQVQKQHDNERKIKKKYHIFNQKNKLKIFSKTVQKCIQNYESMFNNPQKDPIALKNSMNRLIAIDSIKSRVHF